MLVRRQCRGGMIGPRGVEDGCALRSQHFISCSPWDDELLGAQIDRDADAIGPQASWDGARRGSGARSSGRSGLGAGDRDDAVPKLQASRGAFPFIEPVFADTACPAELVAKATRIVVEIVRKLPDRFGVAAPLGARDLQSEHTSGRKSSRGDTRP